MFESKKATNQFCVLMPEVVAVQKSEHENSGKGFFGNPFTEYYISVTLKRKDGFNAKYKTKKDRDDDYDSMIKLIKERR